MNIIKMKKKFKIMLIIISAIIIIIAYYCYIFEPNNLQIKEAEIKLKNLPEQFRGVRIIHLTDFHSKKFGRREKKVLKMVSQLNPDFVFITGDFVDRTTKNIRNCKEFWKLLAQRYQNRVYGVLGNHEYSNSNHYYLKRALSESGIAILNNENKKLFFKDEFINLIGVDDPRTSRDDLAKAMAGADNELPKILLAHSPDILNRIDDYKIDLILCGHTHGGQIRIPFIRPFWTPTKFKGKYAKGLFKVKSSYLYVNPGVGVTFFPIRINCPPEITLIKLEKQ